MKAVKWLIGGVAVAAIAVIVVASGILNSGPTIGGPQVVPTAIVQIVTPTANAVPATPTPEPTKAPEPTANAVQPEPVAAIGSQPPTVPTDTVVYSYTSGGNPISWLNGVQILADGWTRVITAANGDHPAWTLQTRITATIPLTNLVQWNSSGNLQIASHDEAFTITVEIRRDMDAVTECRCDPYTQSYGSNPSGLGGGIFLDGNNASVSVNGAVPSQFDGIGSWQLEFPKDWTGTYVLVVAMKPGGQVHIHDGWPKTKVYNWPLP